MNQRLKGFALFVCILFANFLEAQTTWTGVFSSNWNQSSNWTNGLPGPFNEPIIPATPTGPFFPIITVFTYFNFNVQNYGVINIDGSGGVTLLGSLINHSNATMTLSDASANLLVEASGFFENQGTIVNNGTFNNIGSFTNGVNGVFGNNHIFSHSSGSFLNQGEYNNFGQFFSEASFLNTGEFNNSNLFNNNENTTNAGVMNSLFGSTLRNDLNMVNQPNGTINVIGVFLNNNIFHNKGQLNTSSGSVTTNSYLVRNAIGATWSNQGTFNNVFCAIYENKGTHQNNNIVENEGFIYADSPILPQLPVNTGSGLVISPSNSATLCHDNTVELTANNMASVVGLDLANDQLDFCTGWNILVNGQPNLFFSGCASLGNHNVNVSFTDTFGRNTICTAVVTVIDNMPPVIACQPNLGLQLMGSQCTVAAVLLPPTILAENCTIANIANNAPASFPIGTTLVDWAVSDQDGNTAACTQTVVVFDLLPPTITCPTNKTLNASQNNCGISSQDPAIAGDPALAIDNCGIPVVTNNAPAMIPIGLNTVTWSAVDLYGNIASCQQAVTVVDNQNPVIVGCPSDLTIQAQSGTCQAVATWGQANATDNCGTASQVFSISSGSVFDMGTTTITVLVTDASLNTATCQFNINVVDTIAPVWNNCPTSSSITLLDCGDMAIGNWAVPTASDPCLGQVNSNLHPGDVLPIGSNHVVYTANDLSGNIATCEFNIDVIAQLALDCPDDILVNIGSSESSSIVSWNPPPGVTNCFACASTSISSFEFLGEGLGHRYYMYLGGQVGWQEAKTLAEQHGGYLATIGSAAENDLIRKEFPTAFHTAWIGLSDEGAEGQFTWVNGEPSSFSNWVNGIVPTNDQLDYTALKNDGTWFDQGLNGAYSFIMEIPCYAIDLSSSNPTALASMVFPLGSTVVGYEVTDNCGNTCACDFEVQVVQNQQVVPCVATGNSEYGWIENVQTQGFDNISGDDGGRGNYTSSVFQMPDPGCILKLKPGGPAVDNYLYWRIWADLNMDGDFFDDNEVLGSLEGVGEQNFCYDVLANLPTGPVGLRIAMSRWDYASACGNFLAGEAEDYTVDFIDSSIFNPTNCIWSFGLIDGNTEALKIKLNWIGSGNCNVKHFRIERSSDGVLYELAGEVLPMPNGQFPTLYEFEDKTPFYGHNFYRVLAVLEDGTTVFSNLFETDFNVDFNQVFVYPNPASTELIMHIYPFNGLPAHIFIANAMGQIVYNESLGNLGEEPLWFDLNGFAAGVYTIYLKAEDKGEQVQRFIVASH